VKPKTKIVKLPGLRSIVSNLRSRGKKIIFTNGCFDILHAGHVGYLEKAKGKNSVLIVGLNSDSSVRKIKGKGRPINSQIDRAKILAGLSPVDYIVIFDAATPIKLIKALKPDCLVKGADWKGKTVVGEYFVKQYGGKVKLIRFLKGYSTTKIIQKILKLAKNR
jgi:D-beta-D-heptose 7-phosphate kinase/D-beta-D-heptose 1-phosphate adenosyltransferase